MRTKGDNNYRSEDETEEENEGEGIKTKVVQAIDTILSNPVLFGGAAYKNLFDEIRNARERIQSQPQTEAPPAPEPTEPDPNSTDPALNPDWDLAMDAEFRRQNRNYREMPRQQLRQIAVHAAQGDERAMEDLLLGTNPDDMGRMTPEQWAKHLAEENQ